MIVVNGMEYRTLQQPLYANGNQVLQAYCNGRLVYPERENTAILKILGNINTIVHHDHAGEDPSAQANSGTVYTYLPGEHAYRAKACFSMVIRNYSFESQYNRASFSYQQSPIILPAATGPLTSENGKMVFPYDWSSAPLLPSGDGVHPLLGCPELETHPIRRSGSYYRPTVGVELLLYIDVSAPPVCGWTSPSCYFGLGYPYTDVTATPLEEYLYYIPQDVNGVHWLSSYRRDAYYGFSWTLNTLSGTGVVVHMANGTRSDNGNEFFTRLRVAVDSYSYPSKVTYRIQGTRQGYREFEYTYDQKFNIVNIPITRLLYSGTELAAPIEHLHPRLEDLEEFM